MYRVSVGSTHPLVGAPSNPCLDSYDNRAAHGTKIEIWNCGGGSNQRVALIDAGELQLYGGTGDANQQWHLR